MTALILAIVGPALGVIALDGAIAVTGSVAIGTGAH